jgi:hypothetical protein
MYDIMTRGICPEFSINAQKIVKELYGDYYLTNWMEGTRMDILGLFLSDNSLQLYTTKERSKELAMEFKSWGLFYEVWFRWYGGDTWIVGFNFDYNSFGKLYKEYMRSKKLEDLLNKF